MRTQENVSLAGELGLSGKNPNIRRVENETIMAIHSPVMLLVNAPFPGLYESGISEYPRQGAQTQCRPRFKHEGFRV